MQARRSAEWPGTPAFPPATAILLVHRGCVQVSVVVTATVSGRKVEVLTLTFPCATRTLALLEPKRDVLLNVLQVHDRQ